MKDELTKEELIDMKNDWPLDLQERGDEQTNQKLADEISKFYPAEVIYLLKTEDGKQLFDRSEVRLIHPTLKIRASYNPRDKKYKFHNVDVFRLPYMTYYSRMDAEKGLQIPQQVGVLSHKKIMDWINYLEECFKRCKAVNDANEKKITAFRESIKDLPVRYRYHGRDKESQGDITINGINFYFNITENHIETKITVDLDSSRDHNLENFLKLSDNKYR